MVFFINLESEVEKMNKKRISRKGKSEKWITRRKGLSGKEISSLKVSREYLKYRNYMNTKPNDTVYRRWGMYTHDPRYKEYTAEIVKLIMDDMGINSDQAHYMLYYMVSNNITDYERAKADMIVDEKFEIYKRKGEK
jgi:hypothetical protein